MKCFLKPLLVAALLSSMASAQAADDPFQDILVRDMAEMLEMFPGEYDNQEQVYFEKELGIDENLRHRRTHHHFVPVKVDGIPGETFYAHQYQHNDPENIYRQRIYSFETDFEEMAIRLTIYTPSNPEALRSGHRDTSIFENLSVGDFYLKPGCEVFWKRSGDQFDGYLKEGACNYYSERFGKQIYLNETLMLSEGELWINDTAVDEDGNSVFGAANRGPSKNRKARIFKCWASMPKKDGSWSFDPGLMIHDQGGTAWATTGEDEPARAMLKIRNVSWPTGRNRDSLVLYMYREGEDRAASYAWTEPSAKRIAINLRWVQASCTLEE